MSLLKRIEEIVLNTESRLRNTQQSEADSSKPSTEHEPSQEQEPEKNSDLRFEFAEC